MDQVLQLSLIGVMVAGLVVADLMTWKLLEREDSGRNSDYE